MATSASASQASGTDLSVLRCFASPATSVTAYPPAKEAAMSADAYHAPKTSPRLETLDVLSIGMSLDVFRQGQVWKALQEQNAQAEALHVGSILPMDPKKYPTSADDKDMAYEKRQADALELGLKNFLEKWPIPTVTVVRGWDPSTPNLRFSAERTKRSLSVKVNNLRTPAGLHWHRIANLQDGIICNDTPEGVLEALFSLFERNPDLPAVLVYANEGISMAGALSSRDVTLKSLGAVSGPRIPGKLTDAMVALIVGRPERVDWLRQYAPYTKANENRIDP
ncbi:type VI lipase adapter Tla3 domain-containing protein, partial [Pseudomonas paraeruginosa]